MCVTDGQALLGQVRDGAPPCGGGLPPPLVDHHLHIQSDDISRLLQEKARRDPESFRIFNPLMLETRTGNDAITVLDDAGIGQGVLLSEAYMFASPHAVIAREAIADLTRRENSYNIKAALQSNGRLKAFIGINPLADGASDEMRYWAGRPGVSGLKLHLGNSGFDSASPADIAALAGIFGQAQACRLPIVIHVKDGEPYEAIHTTRFIDEVIPHASDLPIQVAHGGGGGGLDDATVTALSAYADACERGLPGTKNLLIDLSVVLVHDIQHPKSRSLMSQFADLVRRIGPARFLMGSDWPALCPPKQHNELLEMQLPLSEADWHTILRNRAPYLHQTDLHRDEN